MSGSIPTKQKAENPRHVRVKRMKAIWSRYLDYVSTYADDCNADCLDKTFVLHPRMGAIPARQDAGAWMGAPLRPGRVSHSGALLETNWDRDTAGTHRPGERVRAARGCYGFRQVFEARIWGGAVSDPRTIERVADGFQSAYNANRAVRRKVKTLSIRIGETDMGNLTMRPDGFGRREIGARVVRESDWNLLMNVVCEAWWASPEADSGRELVIADAVEKLRKHLEKRRG